MPKDVDSCISLQPPITDWYGNNEDENTLFLQIVISIIVYNIRYWILPKEVSGTDNKHKTLCRTLKTFLNRCILYCFQLR